MPEKPRVTLREIAETAGVSRMTVSLALRGKGKISEETRARILKIADNLGYKPDPELGKLMSRVRASSSIPTHACLALLTSGPTRDAWKRYVTERKYVEGSVARARSYGYQVEEFWLNEPGMSHSRLGKIIWSRGIEGLIIAPIQGKLAGDDPRALKFDFDLFSAVEISETVKDPDLDRALHDQYTSTLRVIEELLALGYRRIGMVLERALDRRVNGRWTAAFARFQIYREPDRLIPPLILPEADRDAFRAWHREHHPDVIISVDRFGLRMIEACGLKIPGDVGYVSLDLDGLPAEYSWISGIDQNSKQVGASAVDLLVGAIQRGQRGVPELPVRIEVTGTWRPGKSTKPQGKRRRK
ncbi:LacI family DNA-binding transcriptional regulator [Haloferula sp.]|uniref:LacI family DNA-binding transcriptional regulator n=1 Tax=Haloferula sp. TaxID=2497595 RepID=UPI003C77E184